MRSFRSDLSLSKPLPLGEAFIACFTLVVFDSHVFSYLPDLAALVGNVCCYFHHLARLENLLTCYLPHQPLPLGEAFVAYLNGFIRWAIRKSRADRKIRPACSFTSAFSSGIVQYTNLLLAPPVPVSLQQSPFRRRHPLPGRGRSPNPLL
jgi:hypothetical protein